MDALAGVIAKRRYPSEIGSMRYLSSLASLADNTQKMAKIGRIIQWMLLGKRQELNVFECLDKKARIEENRFFLDHAS